MLNLIRSIHMILDAMARQDATPFNGPESEPYVPVTTQIRQLREILFPLFGLEDTLNRRICPEYQPVPHNAATQPTTPGLWNAHRAVSPEVMVLSSQYYQTSPDSPHFQPPTAAMRQEIREAHLEIRKYAHHMKALWLNETVQNILRIQKIDMRELSGL